MVVDPDVSPTPAPTPAPGPAATPAPAPAATPAPAPTYVVVGPDVPNTAGETLEAIDLTLLYSGDPDVQLTTAELQSIATAMSQFVLDRTNKVTEDKLQTVVVARSRRHRQRRGVSILSLVVTQVFTYRVDAATSAAVAGDVNAAVANGNNTIFALGQNIVVASAITTTISLAEASAELTGSEQSLVAGTDDGLSSGAVVGITLSALVLLVAIAFAVYVKKQKNVAGGSKVAPSSDGAADVKRDVPVGDHMFAIDEDPTDQLEQHSSAFYGASGARITEPKRTAAFQVRGQSFQTRMSSVALDEIGAPGAPGALPALRTDVSSKVAKKRKQSLVVMDLVAADAHQDDVVSAASKMSVAERKQSILQMQSALAAMMSADESAIAEDGGEGGGGQDEVIAPAPRDESQRLPRPSGVVRAMASSYKVDGSKKKAAHVTDC